MTTLGNISFWPLTVSADDAGLDGWSNPLYSSFRYCVSVAAANSIWFPFQKWTDSFQTLSRSSFVSFSFSRWNTEELRSPSPEMAIPLCGFYRKNIPTIQNPNILAIKHRASHCSSLKVALVRQYFWYVGNVKGRHTCLFLCVALTFVFDLSAGVWLNLLSTVSNRKINSAPLGWWSFWWTMRAEG